MSEARFTLDVSAELNDRIGRESAKNDLSKSQYIRQAVEVLLWLTEDPDRQLLVRSRKTKETHILLIPGLLR